MSVNSDIPVVVVIPCLNEEANLANTCQSLGFGCSETLQNSYLVIVDNGSTDNTLLVANNIQTNSTKDTIFIETELEKGYIPPRHKGNLKAKKLADKFNWYQVLILQADADTYYSPNYIKDMRILALDNYKSSIVEANVTYPKSFSNEYPDLVSLFSKIDNKYTHIFADIRNDLIVDDKACGYWLNDYFEHNGHKREFLPNGDEIHAETSRFYMRLWAQGEKRVRSDSAYVEHSMRKLIHYPLLQVATAGFTREEAWYTHYQNKLNKPASLKELYLNLSHPNVQQAIELRARHLIALFSLLPIHCSVTMGFNSTLNNRHLKTLVNLLPTRTPEDLKSSPSLFMSDVFKITDKLDSTLINHLAANCTSTLFSNDF